VFDDYLADFSASLHDLRPRRRPPSRKAPVARPGAEKRASDGTGVPGHRRTTRGGAFRACLDPDSYLASQELAARLLEAGALGIAYPRVRRAGGTCLACFRPALVGNVRRGRAYRFTWAGTPEPVVVDER
jgi:hypothetical protein